MRARGLAFSFVSCSLHCSHFSVTKFVGLLLRTTVTATTYYCTALVLLFVLYVLRGPGQGVAKWHIFYDEKVTSLAVPSKASMVASQILRQTLPPCSQKRRACL